MEEFRAVIADSVVLTLINNGMLSARDFMTWHGACQLTEAGRRAFFQAYEQRKATVVTHPVFGYRMSYGRMLEVQARMLAAYVRGDVPAYRGLRCGNPERKNRLREERWKPTWCLRHPRSEASTARGPHLRRLRLSPAILRLPVPYFRH